MVPRAVHSIIRHGHVDEARRAEPRARRYQGKRDVGGTGRAGAREEAGEEVGGDWSVERDESDDERRRDDATRGETDDAALATMT